MTDNELRMGEPREVHVPELFQMVPNLPPNQINVLRLVREVIPIVFVPGIMGSVLVGWDADKNKNDVLWDPGDPAMMFNRYGWRTSDAKKKRRLLIGTRFNPDRLSVRGQNRVDSPHKGWEGVSLSSYGELLSYLDAAPWVRVLRACFYLPVHAFGYNWTASNSTSADKLKTFVDQLMAHYRHNKGRRNGKCDRVILVTHSMGGLVARAACLDSSFQDKVLGVLHGVQPVDGAPAAFWRIKAGFERSSAIAGRVTAWVLGTNGHEVTALVANMPGGLELLPNKHYRKHWLRYHWKPMLAAFMPEREFATFPRANPYEEIYKVRDPNSLARMVTPAMLNPGAQTETHIEREWDNYIGRVNDAEAFHDRLGHHHHPQTYTFYGTGEPTAETVEFECDLDIIDPRESNERPEPWEDHEREGYERQVVQWYRDSNQQLRLKKIHARLQEPSGRGDGTVPVSSAAALGQPDNSGGSMPTRRRVPGLEHEPAYAHRDMHRFTAMVISEMLYKHLMNRTGLSVHDLDRPAEGRLDDLLPAHAR